MRTKPRNHVSREAEKWAFIAGYNSVIRGVEQQFYYGLSKRIAPTLYNAYQRGRELAERNGLLILLPEDWIERPTKLS